MKNKDISGIAADIKTLAKTKNISQTEALRQAVHTLHVHLQGQIDRQTAKKDNEYNWSNDFG
jgi:hypothetical protein